MTTASTNGSRVLMPTAEYFPQDGAALVRLSPHKTLKNAATIYNVIKKLPDKTLVRADFDNKLQPFIYFPDRPKKKIGQSENKNIIQAKSIEAGRKEMASILSSIAIEAVKLQDSNTTTRKTALLLNQTVSLTEGNQRDFKVGDIKASLHVLANAYTIDQVRKTASPHRLLNKQVTKIQNKRLREFVAISKKTADDIHAALAKNHSKKYDLRPQIGLFSIKLMVRQFLDQKSLSSKSFASFVRQCAHDPDIQFFAQRWHAISQPKPSDERIQFSTEPWAKELDQICEMILKENRRSTRFVKVDAREDHQGVSTLVLPSNSTMQRQSLPQTDKLEYSSLRTEDTDDSSSFPSPPMSQNQDSELSEEFFEPALSSQQMSGYLDNAAEQEKEGRDLSNKLSMNGDITVADTAEKIVYQSLETSHGFLALQESIERLNESELEPLLNPVAEESDSVIESSNMEEKTEKSQ